MAGLTLPQDPGFEVIETFGWDGGRYCRVWAHLARIQATCRALGIAFDRGQVLVRLDALPVTEGVAARIRVAVGRAGGVTVSHAPLPASSPLWRLGLAAERVQSGDPWRRVKTSERGLYDRARAALPAGTDELIFLNERDEVAEGAITTVFFDAGQGLCTPPLCSGLLPGVLRAEMVAKGCREQVLWREDLGRVQLWVGNSLRGMIPAEWAGEA